jgi:aldehyde:ferredoxin oxidoreductase
MAKLLRVDMSRLQTALEEFPSGYASLGGRGLSARIINTEVVPTCHPLGRENKLVFAPGLLTGSGAPSSGRLSVGGKSPLTAGIKEANVGGTAGQKIARLGLRAIVVEGQPEKGRLFILRIDSQGGSILPADELAGLGNYATARKLRERYGEKVGILSIGPAGEMKLAAASVACTDSAGRPARHAARGGLGALMGSKGVKAIVIDDSQASPGKVQDRAAFREASLEFARMVKERRATFLLSHFGTVGGLVWLSKWGSLVTRNFTAGSFDRDAQIGGKGIAELTQSRGGRFGDSCMPGCIVRCSNIFHDPEGNFLTAGLEFESVAMLGSNLGMDNIDAIAAMEKMCDDLGLDTIEVGATLGITTEAGLLEFGDSARALALIREIGQGTPLGRVLGQGVAVTARVLGLSRVPVVKGQGVPAHDPRVELGTGVTYATSPMGADHTAGLIYKAGSPAEMVQESRQAQIVMAAVDSLGLCSFSEPTLAIMAKLVNGVYGWSWTEQDVAALGRAVLKEEKSFNEAAGWSRASDRLPQFFKEEPIVPSGALFNIPDSELDRVLEF